MLSTYNMKVKHTIGHDTIFLTFIYVVFDYVLNHIKCNGEIYLQHHMIRRWQGCWVLMCSNGRESNKQCMARRREGAPCPLVVLMGTRFAMLVSPPTPPLLSIPPSLCVCTICIARAYCIYPDFCWGCSRSFDSCSRCFVRIKYVEPNIQEYPSKNYIKN